MKFVHGASFLLIAFAASIVTSQDDYPRHYFSGAPTYGGLYGHASTAEEGFQRGLADMIRSRGAANLMNSEAAKNYAEAYREQISNRMYATQTYFEMRALNKSAREAERGPRPTTEDIERYARMRAPERLSVSQLDPLTGELAWPTILQQSEYQAEREKLELLYQARAQYGSLTVDQMQDVRLAAASLGDSLKANIDNYPPEAYVQAKKFVDGLSTEIALEYQ